MSEEYEPFVHRVVDRLARRALQAAGDVTDPEAWLRTVRHRMWVRYKDQLTVDGITTLLLGERGVSVRRDYAHHRPTCATCDGLSLVPAEGMVDAWQRCPTCTQ